MSDGLTAAVEKMRAQGLGETAIKTFEHYYLRLREGDRGLLPEADLEPVEAVTDFAELAERSDAVALNQTVVLKLNGGLGTSMGMTKAKSLLEVKDGLTFLDIVATQIKHIRAQTGARLPLVLMNSFATRDDSLAALSRHQLNSDVPADFLQNMVPKLHADDLAPASWPQAPELEWAPPGHGDLYVALVASGMLATLLDAGYRYAFVSNADNLGAVLDERILAWIAANEIPFVMEVADRTPADRKGGHLAARPEGGLVLREIAQTPADDLEAFQDIERHRFFNTNTLWLDLLALQSILVANNGVLALPMIVNEKHVDPTDGASPAVLQLETAMGAAIDVFEGAQALRVPKARFAPVKTTNDLLALRSDAYELTDAGQVVLVPERRDRPPVIDLDPSYFKLVADFEARFPAGPPSLRACDRFTVRGDITFGPGVVARGDVNVSG
ncbi:MAG TPA: UTP--glucose-1-phosphate uridylyltransferase [Baekduia sp.]|nr:UTP--glucose-1-phosphate uridylyltransferase [Baekduia sp.]